MQFQLYWRQHHRDLSVPDGILRPNRYAGRIPKSNQFDTHKLQTLFEKNAIPNPIHLIGSYKIALAYNLFWFAQNRDNFFSVGLSRVEF